MSVRVKLAAAGVLLIALVLAGVWFAYRAAVGELKQRVRLALGPDCEIGALEIGTRTLELRDVRLKPRANWPAESELRVTRMRIEPELWSLVAHDRLRIAHLSIDGGYLAVVRSRSGAVEVLPSLLQGGAAHAASAGASAGMQIATVDVSDFEIEFVDSSLRTAAQHIRASGLAMSISSLDWPSDGERTQLTIDGQMASASGHASAGGLHLAGWFESQAGAADLHLAVAGVDLKLFEPYFLRATERTVKSGTFDLVTHSRVQKRRLEAPVEVTLNHMELSDTPGLGLGTLIGVPRHLVLAGLENSRGQLELRFTLTGDVSAGSFALAEDVPTQTTAALAAGLGISLGDIFKSIGNVGTAAADTGARVVEGIGSAVDRSVKK